MVKLVSTLGQLNTPRAGRGIANIDASPIKEGLLTAARLNERGVNSIQKGLGVLQQEAERIQAEDDRRQAVELDNEFAKRISALQYGDGTEQNPGYFNLQGNAAITGYAGQEQKIEGIKQELLKKASSQRVKDMFSLAAGQRQTTEVESMRKHVGKARIDAADAADKVRFIQAQNDAAAAPGNMEVLARSVAIAENTAVAYGKRHGMSPEEIAAAVTHERSNVYIQAVKAAMTTDPAAADLLYQNNKHNIEGTARAEIENVLMTQTLAAKGQSIAEEAMANAKGEAAQLAYIRDNYEGKYEEEAVRELKERYSEADTRRARNNAITEAARSEIRWQHQQAAWAEEAARKDAKKSAFQAIEGGIPLTKWASDNPEQFNALDVYDWQKLENRETSYKKGLEYADVSDPKVKADLWGMAPGPLMDIDPMEVKGQLTENDFENFLTMRRATEDRLNRESNNQSYYKRMEYMLKDYAPKDGKPGAQKLTIDDATMNAAQNQAAAEIYEAIQGGKKIDDKFLREQAQRLMAPVYRARTGWWDDVQGVVGSFQDLTADEQKDAYIPKDKISPEMFADIQKQLKASGKDSEDEILIGKIALALLLRDENMYNTLMAK